MSSPKVSPDSHSGLTPAILAESPTGHAPGVPYSPVFDDVYHSAAGAWAQARHVFLSGNGLPGRWQGRERFVILETGFGLGNNFLATWAAWRADPQRCTRLVFISIEKHPLLQSDLVRVHQERALDTDEAEAQGMAARLCQAWPSLTPGMHTLDFDESGLPGAGPRTGVTLLLGLGDIATLLPAIVASVDAFFLDGFAPAKNPAMWDEGLISRLNRLAAPGATAATWSVARGVRDALTQAGFRVEKVQGFGGKRDMTQAVFEPRFTPPPLPGGLWPAPAETRHAMVIGAGLAGCAAAWALTRDGWRVTLMDRHEAPAQEASGNPGGLFHSIVHASDGVHARAHRAAALQTMALAGPWVRSGRVDGQCEGLLRLEPRLTDQQAHQRLAALGLPSDHVQWLDRPSASQRAGLDLPSGAWLFAQGGWLHPAGYAQALLEEARQTGLLQWQGQCHVRQVRRQEDGLWQALDAEGRPLADAPTLVLANASHITGLLASATSEIPPLALPLTPIRGQITWLAADHAQAHPPALPVAGGGYVLRLKDGRLLCGATTQHHDDDPTVRATDHTHNLTQAGRLGAWSHSPTTLDGIDIGPLHGRVGWRASTSDRLPMVGAAPLSPHALNGTGRWPDQVRRIPRLRDAQGGLYVIGGLGSRGITWAALAGRLLSHWVSGAPCPVEVDLRDALDPARFALKPPAH
ncbi:MAG TPA: FAD-dependent 5-carboxymethylaminomethyl-2-thiouridine(34) oxidoreductase MnmC [Aquabacterium sp.]|uniref:FAD-dependent 5-carboxymethylaminomethyl-2-thiouridine(34) oxidoreductase MnmC n=1 Tax=Aquabacterium sp. TaxID=1872578 RepID=UPI002E2F083F|nr:FAD-dependent 5-carboxymethylaminomethyl-2-thiouridine(34) oxidoreductase MnmC [Aquabacterium sp.]HEX5371757.1 FAD-dependent 5-carboxymethylaminomethyl-2-thiouridine(34) oxidoreductase MnmC [Aquabacterium sp.]